MSRINSNIPALQALHRVRNHHADLNRRLERLSTGLRINRGRDDPAGLIVSENLRTEIKAIAQAIKNSTRASNLLSVAEGALNETSALLLELKSLALAAANEDGLLDQEVAANQLVIDSILDSIDRISITTTFGGQKLLDGSKAYTLSSVPTTELASISLFSAGLPSGGSRTVTVRVTQSAQTARIGLIGTNATGVSRTSATTITIRGALGSTVLSFVSGTTLADIRMAVNAATSLTGVQAVVSTPAVGAVASAMVLSSTELGSDAFVSVQPISGNFVESGNNNAVLRAIGTDAGVLIDGQRAAVKGLRADVRSTRLDLRLYLTPSFGQTLSSASFTISGGGAVFQIAPEISPNGQIFVGLTRMTTTDLGNAVTGLLYTLRSGQTNDLNSKNFVTTASIVEEAIVQVASFRGRLGTFQRNHIDSNINAQRIALENVTASESVIRDADMALEVSALTRAQILVQSTQSTLQIANAVPNLVLSLLG